MLVTVTFSAKVVSLPPTSRFVPPTSPRDTDATFRGIFVVFSTPQYTRSVYENPTQMMKMKAIS